MAPPGEAMQKAGSARLYDLAADSSGRAALSRELVPVRTGLFPPAATRRWSVAADPAPAARAAHRRTESDLRCGASGTDRAAAPAGTRRADATDGPRRHR